MTFVPIQRIDADVAVVGSGFAGSLVSLALTRRGRRVVMIERGRHPRFAIGESSTPLANRIAAAPPIGIRMLKRSLNRSADIMGFRNSLMAHFDTHILSTSTKEHFEVAAAGMRASMEAAKKAQS